MFEVVIKKLVHSLRARNARIINELDKWQDEMEIDIILGMIEDYGAKISFTITNRFNGNIFISNLEHACHRCHDENVYHAIHLDFSKVFKKNRKNGKMEENDVIVKTMSELGFALDGAVATCDKLTF